MQRFINNPDEVVEDTVKGFVKAHADIVSPRRKSAGHRRQGRRRLPARWVS